MPGTPRTRGTFAAVLRRELALLVTLPQTYAVATAFAVISGIFFVNILISTSAPDLGRYYSNIASTLIVLVPIVAMRSFAEERRSGALDLTLSWPLSRLGLVAGKFTANTLFVWVLACLAWVYHRILSGLGGVQTGRVVGGFLGLLVLSAAFNAVALAVSARAASPTAAAFLGFGVLLFLWILEFAPGWIGRSLRTLGPSAHFEAFPRGVVYAEDLAYFATVIVVGLGLAVSGLGRSGRRAASRVRRNASLAGVVALWLVGSGVAGAVEGQADLTDTSRFTLTEASKAVVRRVDGQVGVTGFAEPISREAAELRSLVTQYRAAGVDIALEVVDPDARPALAKELGVSGYGQYLVELGGRRELVDDIGQISMTSAILRLSRTEPPRACFTVGHGERDTDDETITGLSKLRTLLSRISYEVEPLALGAPGGAAGVDGCDVVVVAGPRVPFLPSEVALLSDFARRDGRLVVMTDGAAGPEAQLNDLLRPWGVTFGSGAVRDVSALAEDPASVVSFDYPSKSPPVVRLQQDEIPVVLIGPRPIERAVQVAEEGWLSPLVRSSPKSWLESPGGGRTRGPFVLGAVVDWSRVVGQGSAVARTRIGVVGTVEMAANRFIDVFGNADFVTGLIQWVARDDDVISAGRSPGGGYKILLTNAQKSDIVRQGIVLPALATLAPLPVALLRLRRG